MEQGLVTPRTQSYSHTMPRKSVLTQERGLASLCHFLTEDFLPFIGYFLARRAKKPIKEEKYHAAAG
jgi:hypothetical protein